MTQLFGKNIDGIKSATGPGGGVGNVRDVNKKNAELGRTRQSAWRGKDWVMRELFLGPLRYWLLWIGILAVLFVAGQMQLHTINFRSFLLILIALSLGCVLTIVLTRKRGERVTRAPLEEDD